MSGDGLSDWCGCATARSATGPTWAMAASAARSRWMARPGSPTEEQFDQQRVRLADIDGSGTNDLLYLGRRRHPGLLQSVGQRLEAQPQTLSPLPHLDRLRRCMTVGPAGQRHGLPGLVVAAAGRCRPAAALYRPDGRPEAAPAAHGQEQPGRGNVHPVRLLHANFISRTSWQASPGSRAWPFRCMSSSAWRRLIASAATAS